MDTTVDWVSALARLAFGLILLIKIAYSIDLRGVLWAHHAASPQFKPSVFQAQIVVWVISALCFAAGLFTDLSILILWLTHLYLFRVASLYTMEDLVFHALLLYFVFAGSGAVLSVDGLMDIRLWGRVPSGTLFPEVLLALLMGLMFWGGGWTKLSSPMWKSGWGAYFFFINPKAKRLSTDFLTSRPGLIRAVNYSSLVMELGVLPAFLLNMAPLGLIFWTMTLVFSLTLCTFVKLRWIGETFIVGHGIILVLIFELRSDGLCTYIFKTWQRMGPNLPMIAFGAIAAVVVTAAFWTTTVSSDTAFRRGRSFLRAHRLMRAIARHTCGMIPVDVFTERHLKGMVLFRVLTIDRNGESHEVFQLYDQRGEPCDRLLLEPSTILTIHTKIGEICMELDLHHKVTSISRLILLKALVNYILAKSRRQLAGNVSHLRFSVMQLVNPTEFVGPYAFHLHNPWRQAFDVHFETATPDGIWIDVLNFPILTAETGRRLDRDSCAYNALSS